MDETRNRLLLFAPACALLVAEPVRWLATTWLDPSYDNDGWVAALLAAVLLVRSVRSGPALGGTGRAVPMLLASALARLAGHLLAVNTVGALALVVDVWALGLALRVRSRPWSLPPGVVATLFAFALPLENVLQRLAGYPLQLASSALAGRVVGLFVPGLLRTGTLLTAGGVQLSVDLPCSGARGLVLLGGLAALVAARRRLTGRSGPALLLAVPLGALVANTLRIVLLFVASRAGLDPFAEPLHSTLGLVALVAGSAPLLGLAGRLADLAPRALAALPVPAPPRSVALLLSAAAVVVLVAAPRPLDVGSAVQGPALPSFLAGAPGVAAPMSERESLYFTTFGGAAQKRIYSGVDGVPHTVVVVRTGAPLRHLHGPDRCLVGAGHRVQELGVRRGAVPAALYRSVGPDGRAWLVEASFVSDRGETAASVAEVAWRWLASPRTAWTLVERVSPWDACATDDGPCRALDQALFRALDLVPDGSMTVADHHAPEEP